MTNVSDSVVLGRYSSHMNTHPQLAAVAVGQLTS